MIKIERSRNLYKYFLHRKKLLLSVATYPAGRCYIKDGLYLPVKPTLTVGIMYKQIQTIFNITTACWIKIDQV
jgi:hypothetical protein